MWISARTRVAYSEHTWSCWQLRGAIQQQFQQLNVHQTAVLSNMIQLFEQVKQLQTRVLDLELIGWKHRQKSAGNGYKMPENKLDRLQVGPFEYYSLSTPIHNDQQN